MTGKSPWTKLPTGLIWLVLSSVVVAVQLPPEIQADRHLVRAERAIDEQDFHGAKAAMDAILELQAEHDLELPAAFSFRYAEVLERLGLYDEAIEYITAYLAVAGRDGEYYREALELLDSAEETSRRLRTERELADAARRQEEAVQRATDELVQRQINEAGIPLPRDELRSGGLAPEMVRIASGRFQYLTAQSGAPGGYHHWVEFEKAFAISRYEITLDEFERFVDESDYRPATDRGEECKALIPSQQESLRWDSRQDRFYSDGEDPRPTDAYPVFCVTIHDAIAYADWLSEETEHTYRLPSAAEWQYAARAGAMESVRAKYPESHDVRCSLGLGNMPEESRQFANCNDEFEYVAPVGRFAPNGIGLHDMFGNLAEWVLACQVDPNELDRGGLYYYARPDGALEHIETCPVLLQVAVGDNWETLGSGFIYPTSTGPVPESSAVWIGIRVVRLLTDEELR